MRNTAKSVELTVDNPARRAKQQGGTTQGGDVLEENP